MPPGSAWPGWPGLPARSVQPVWPCPSHQPGQAGPTSPAQAAPAAPAKTELPWLRLAAAGLLLALLLGAPSLLQGLSADDAQALAEEHAAVFANYERASAALIESLEARRDDMSPATLDTSWPFIC